MNINQYHPRNERIRLATRIQWVKKGYRWVKRLWQEQANKDYYCFGKTPRSWGEMIDTYSQQLKRIIWQSYQRPAIFR